MKRGALSILCFVTLGLGFSGISNALTVFSDDFTGDMDWSTSDDSVYTKDNDYLHIGSDGGYADWAEKNLDVSLGPDSTVVLKQRMKLDSGGLNYRLPYERVYFEDDTFLYVGYLPGSPYGWLFSEFDHDQEPAEHKYEDIQEPVVPGEDYWARTRIVLTSTGGTLYMKPDDSDNGWFESDYTEITTATWSHSSIAEVMFEQPWDSVNSVDYQYQIQSSTRTIHHSPPRHGLGWCCRNKNQKKEKYQIVRQGHSVPALSMLMNRKDYRAMFCT